MKIGVFGSAFNPPTNGHIDIVSQAIRYFDKIILVPSFSHAFGKKMINFDTRTLLTNIAFENFPKERVEVSTIERLMFNGKPIYTWELLEKLQESVRPEDSLTFICGPDNVENFEKFANHEQICERWGIWGGIDRTAIRSTIVRDRAKRSLPIDNLVPEKTKNIILELYKNEKSNR